MSNALVITVTKAEKGYVDASGAIYSEKEVIFNRRSFVIEGEAQPKKAKKGSRKSSYTPSNAWRGATVLGESAYTSQARSRYGAMVELVVRANEVTL
jgi:hypothetical protein